MPVPQCKHARHFAVLWKIVSVRSRTEALQANLHHASTDLTVAHSVPNHCFRHVCRSNSINIYLYVY